VEWAEAISKTGEFWKKIKTISPRQASRPAGASSFRGITALVTSSAMTEVKPTTANSTTRAFSSDLAKTYDPKLVETHWYEIWDKAGYFQPQGEGRSYTIVIPPPNVTGSLHMGHALNNTLQDILIRYRKMQGFSALWVPGTDHGGIATQNVVEKILKKEGLTRQDLGREKFLERMWAWRGESGDTILMQLKRLGASLDWTRTRFTMDEVCSRAVRHAFVELYNRKLLYRGKRLVNWCPRCQTALADIEVEHEDVKGNLWHIRYPLQERRKKPRTSKKKASGGVDYFEKGCILVATTRPETMLGDTAVAVNPKDKRYKELIGLHVKLPLTNRLIPIIADSIVDKSFGSGAVKVTPAHDPVDFEIAARAKLPHIAVINFEGKMTEEAGPHFAGLNRFDARKKVVEELEGQGLLEKIEDYNLAVSVCYRCGEIIEPLESEQWFLSMSAMAKDALSASKKGKVRIVPSSWENPYRLWLRNLKDWCVSRQIWWGHRIPVWYCEKDDTPSDCPPIVSEEPPQECPQCKNKKLVQDSDVLDTWFSSALWPFSVFGWPEETQDLKKFFPTSTLVTGHEILYLWVARMVMFALCFRGKVPFDTVFIHGIVRDRQGRKMSKSLGNVIDPLELIGEYGADATRFALAQSAAPGRDMQLAQDNFLAARNFSNKIWNAVRFSLVHLKDLKAIPQISSFKPNWELSDRWILHRFNEVVRDTTVAMENFDLDSASRNLYNFFWFDLCDWYLEMIKPRFDRERWGENGITEKSAETARATLAHVLEGILRLLHPFVPFITEELWQKLPKHVGNKSAHIMAASWPRESPELEDSGALKEMNVLQETVTKLRAIRSEMGIPINERIEIVAKIEDPKVAELLEKQKVILKSLNTKVQGIKYDNSARRPGGSAASVIPGAVLFVPLLGLIDFGKEKARLEKELGSERENVEHLTKKLSNQDFLANAPADEIERVKNRLEEAQARVEHLAENIAALSA